MSNKKEKKVLTLQEAVEDLRVSLEDLIEEIFKDFAEKKQRCIEMFRKMFLD